MAPSTMELTEASERLDRAPEPVDGLRGVPTPPRPPSPRARRMTAARLLSLTVMAAGLGLIVLAGTLVFGRVRSQRATPLARTLSNPTAVSTFPQVGVARQSYKPGHSSGWHVHPGVHSVVVLSGTLTIYDQDCRRQDYGPGDVYLGGTSPHLARDEASEPVELAVTYVFASSPTLGPGTTAAAPTGCQVR